MRRAAALLFLCGLALVPVMHPLHVDLLGSVLIPADVCLIAAGAAWLLAAARRQVPFRWGPFPVAVGCYLAVVLLGAARGATTEAVNYLVIGFYVGGLGLLAYNLVPVVIGFDAVVKAWLVGTAIAVGLALVGVLLFYAGVRSPRDNGLLTGYGNVPAGDYPRISGVFLNPNMFCNYLVISGLFLVAAIERGWLSTARGAAALLALGVAVAFTLSPGLGDVGLAGALWAGWSRGGVLSARLRRATVVVGTLGAIGFAVLTCISLGAAKSGAIHASPRVHVWHQAATTFVHHPLLGAGLGGRIVHFRIAPGGEYITDAHNVWLSIAAQLGLLGVVALAAVLIAAVGRQPGRLLRAPIPRALVIAVVCTFFYEGLSMSVEHFRHVWLVLGLLAAVTGSSHSMRSRSPSALEAAA